MKMKLNFLFLTKLLVSVFLVCGLMFFVACGDDDDEKTGEIAGVYEGEYNSGDEFGIVKVTFTFNSDKTGSYVFVIKNNGNTLDDDTFTWTNEGNAISYTESNGTTRTNITFDGKDTMIYRDTISLKRKK
jgi:major membrane immunogen (membrane-anchored lipoprotein)